QLVEGIALHPTEVAIQHPGAIGHAEEAHQRPIALDAPAGRHRIGHVRPQLGVVRGKELSGARTAPASGEHSQAIAAAISSGRVSAGFSSPMARMMTTFEVAVVPARSRPTEIVSASTAAFVAAYAACFGVGV